MSNQLYAQAFAEGYVVDYWWLVDTVTCFTALDPAEYPVGVADEGSLMTEEAE